jgi:hypothetical protein
MIGIGAIARAPLLPFPHKRERQQPESAES